MIRLRVVYHIKRKQIMMATIIGLVLRIELINMDLMKTP
jgi:hypothetical protein